MEIPVPVIVAIISGITGGGLIAGFVSLYTARKKVPVERDSIIVNGAESAVLSLERTLAHETARADRAEALVAKRDEEINRKDARIEALEKRLDEVQAVLDAAREELHLIRTSTD